MQERGVPLLHLLLGLAVVAVWGTNFVVIKIGLDHLPPLLFAGLRFVLAVFPMIFFLKRPPVPWSHLAAYGVLIGAGQFGLMFLALRGMISPGLASLVVQVQVFFTIGLSLFLHGEPVRPVHLVALLLAATGIGVIAAHADPDWTPLGLAMVVLAALAWSGGNLVAKRSGRVNMLAYVVWSSLFAAPPLLVLSLIFEGWGRIAASVQAADAATWASLVWQTVGNSLFGYAAWGWLLARHPAASITPMALLVPVFGIGASAFFLGEPLQDWKLQAALLVMGGLALNMLWPWLVGLRRRLPAE